LANADDVNIVGENMDTTYKKIADLLGVVRRLVGNESKE
jgi:hypothetical protein